MRELDKLGYSVDAFVLNAKHWVPQSRPRLFVLAKLADGADRVTWTMTSESRPPSLTRFIADHQDICWDIFALPALPESGLRLQDILDVPNGDDHDWWPEDRASYFINQLSERHSEEASRMIAGKTISYATAFRRMRNKKSTAEIRTDGIAGCLRTPRGGSARQILFEAGLGTYRVRLLRPSECAKLQGVDQTYRIDVALNQALAGFGDAVCVPVIRWIEQNVIRPAYCQIQLGASRRQPTPELSARHDANEILRFHSKDVVR
jgi:DNA (cytosine-5)-methyltransferase 1